MDLEWIRDDAKFLRENGRLRGCVCFLLILVDALAAKLCPDQNGNKARYCAYLEDGLNRVGHKRRIRVDSKGRCLPLSEIIYEYFRCSLIHEADPRDSGDLEVQLQYEGIDRSVFGAAILFDRPREQLIVDADWLADVLFEVTGQDLGV